MSWFTCSTLSTLLICLFALPSLKAHIPWLEVPDPLVACTTVQLKAGAPVGGGPPFLITIFDLPDSLFLASEFNLSTLNLTSSPIFSFPTLNVNFINWTVTLPPSLRIAFQICNTFPNEFAGWCDIGSVRVIQTPTLENGATVDCLGVAGVGILSGSVASEQISKLSVASSLAATPTPNLSSAVASTLASLTSFENGINSIAATVNTTNSLNPSDLSSLALLTSTVLNASPLPTPTSPSPTLTNSVSPTALSDNSNSTDNRTGIIVGSTLGPLGLLILILALLCCCCFKRVRRKNKSREDGMGYWNKNWPFLTLPMATPTEEMGFKPRPTRLKYFGQWLGSKIKSLFGWGANKAVRSVV